MIQPELMPMFNGADYTPERDNPRLTKQLGDVFNAMMSGERHTLAELEAKTGHPQASISAQLRHLRKPRFGGFTIEKQFTGNGTYVYWMEL
jgi:hypothetical protein